MSCEATTVDLLRHGGHKMTPQRMMIVTSLCHAGGHRSAVDIFESAKANYPYMDISTVYRTLDVLKDLRLVSETHMGGSEATYEWVAPQRHHHLVCRSCGAESDLDSSYLADLGKRIEKNLGFKADLDHFAIFGRCSTCVQQADARDRRREGGVR